jgi:EF-hand domain pair
LHFRALSNKIEPQEKAEKETEMKKAFTAILATVLLTGSVLAAEGAGRAGKKGKVRELGDKDRVAARAGLKLQVGHKDFAKWKARHPHVWKHMLKRWDANGDGKLNEGERKTAHQGLKERREAIKDKFDANDDGKLSGEEWKALHKSLRKHRSLHKALHKNPKLRAKILEKFDANGDGKITGEEHKGILKHMRKNRQKKEGGDKDQGGAPEEDGGPNQADF